MSPEAFIYFHHLSLRSWSISRQIWRAPESSTLISRSSVLGATAQDMCFYSRVQYFDSRVQYFAPESSTFAPAKYSVQYWALENKCCTLEQKYWTLKQMYRTYGVKVIDFWR